MLVQRPSTLLQVSRHRVEGGGQLAQLVAAPDLEPLGEVPARHGLGAGQQCLDRPGEAEGEQVPDEQQDEDDPGKQHRHLEGRLQPRVDDAAARQPDGERSFDVLPEIKVRELEFVGLAPDGETSGRCPAGRRQRQIGAQVLVDEIAVQLGHGATQEVAIGVEQGDLRLRPALHVAQHRRKRRLDQDASDHPVRQHHGPGGGQGRRG